jgi:hypothetical protein
MGNLFKYIAALSMTTKLVYSAFGVVLIWNWFRFLERKLPPRFGYGDQRYRVRKAVTAAV